MKLNLIFFIIFSQLAFAQKTNLSNEDINDYVFKINNLKSKDKLKKIEYPQMSSCGGSLNGYYLNNELVLIDATYNAELGFQNKKLFLKNKNYVRIDFLQHTAEWDKFKKLYPPNKYEYDSSKMTYEDIFTTINLSRIINSKKYINKKFVSDNVDTKLIEKLINCGNEMQKELSDFN